ncbi:MULTISPECIES: DUF6020 family protein [unclassified Luteococcus]|uniref:DUF6020 family protein n=1 Tax=unclassified Luteococcus TaxID=2639923 RepID=UPI00313F1295
MISELPLRRVGIVALVTIPLALLFGYLNQPRPNTVATGPGPLHPVLAWLLLSLGILLAPQLRSRLAWVAAGSCAVVMTLARLVGAHFWPAQHPPFERPGWLWLPQALVDLAVLLSLAVLVLLALGQPRRALRWRRWGRGRTLAAGLAAVVVMLLAWTPWLLIFYPGLLVRDSWSSLHLGLGDWPMNNHHPVLFSLWVGQCMRFARWFGGGLTMGVLIYSVVQAVLLATGLATVVLWLWRRLGRWPAVLSLVFFALSPQIAMWSVTVHKDTLFVLWMTLLALLMTETAHRGLAWLLRPAPLTALVLLLLAIAFSRNNGPWVGVGLVALLMALALPRLLRPRRDGWRWWRLPLAGAVALGTVFAVQGPVYRQAGVIPGEYVETVGLPLQQLTWAMAYGRTTPEQQGLASNLMPVQRMRETLTPTIVDSVKFDQEFNTEWLNHHPEEFMGLWREVLPANRLEYAQAWYGLAGGYLDPNVMFTRHDPGTTLGAAGLTVESRDLLGPLVQVPHLNHVSTRVARRVTSQPGINLLYSMPLVFWLCALAALAALLARRPSGALPFVPFLLLVGTLLLAAPLTDFRYVAAGHVGLPVLLAAAWIGRPVRPVGPADDEH